jgi:hypothetical protein
MKSAELVKVAIAVGILGLVSFTMFRGQGWWWRFSTRSRITFALFAVAAIVAAGFFYMSQR